MFTKRKKSDYAYKKPGELGTENPKLIWEEYRYRHEFCWSLVSRITLITTTLSILPYISNGDEFTIKGKVLVNFTPFIGVFFAILGSIRLYRELKLLDRIRRLYRLFQNAIVTPELALKSSFTLEVMIYIILLTVASIVNLILVLHELPALLNRITER